MRHTIAMVTYFVAKVITTCLPMVARQYFDTMTVTLSYSDTSQITEFSQTWHKWIS